MIGQTVSHYRIVEKLGQGGMGSVYVAEDTHLGRRVAIKFPTDKGNEHHFRARFLREARAISALSHPNIATIFDYGETEEGQPFIVMELVNGDSLNDLLHNGHLTLARAVEIITDVGEALTEAHSRGIIHRDIKPSNVMVNERGQVRVLDFGLAKQLIEEHHVSADPDARTLLATRTQSGVVVGTPLYLSPEQARSAPVDARSDIFALGTLLYECIAGRPAFSGNGIIEIAAQVIHINPPPPSQINRRVPIELDRITMKALAKRPEERYQSAEEMVADLRAAGEELQSGDETVTRKIPRADATEPRNSALMTVSEAFRRPRISLFAFVAAILVITLAGLAVYRWTRTRAHQPSAESLRWYQEGTNALRDGTYYKASKILEQAVQSDNKFALAHARLAEALTELDFAERAKDEMLLASSLVTDRSALAPLDALYLQAITQTVSRDFAGAVESYRAITQQATDAEKSFAYIDLGRAYEKNGDAAQAIEAYAKATELDSRAAAAYLRLGVLYGRQQNVAASDAAFSKAQNLYQTLSNVEGEAEVLYQRGVLFSNRSQLTEARAELQKALDLARNTDNVSQQIRALLQISGIYSLEGDTSQAEGLASQAIDLARANGLENLATSGLINLGNAFLLKGNFDDAGKYYRQALEFAQHYKGRANEARAQFSLGNLGLAQGHTDEAIAYVQQALPFYQQGGYRAETFGALTLLARTNRQKGDYNAALNAFTQLLETAKRASDQAQVQIAEEGIGTVMLRQGQYPDALNHFEQSFAAARSLNNPQKTIPGFINRADIFWRLGRYDEAGDALSQAKSLASRPEGYSKTYLAVVSQTEAEMALSQRRFPEAKAYAEQALTLAGEQSEDAAFEAKLALGLAQSLSGAKNDGVKSCQEAFDMASHTGDPWRVLRATLALSRALLEAGDARGALDKAVQAQQGFDGYSQQELEWRAYLLAALASQKLGDNVGVESNASHASDLLAQLEQKWGSDNYRSYLNRPDVQYSRKQLSEVVSAKRVNSP